MLLTGADMQHGSVWKRVCVRHTSAQIRHHSLSRLHICASEGNPDACKAYPFIIPLHEIKEWLPFSLSTLFIGVSRKKINDYRVNCENPAGTKTNA